jgi:hypothetical protein
MPNMRAHVSEGSRDSLLSSLRLPVPDDSLRHKYHLAPVDIQVQQDDPTDEETMRQRRHNVGR